MGPSFRWDGTNHPLAERDDCRVLISGDRDWADWWIIERILDGLHDNYSPDFTLIEGCARGADSMAEGWSLAFGEEYPVDHQHYPAKWDEHGRSAGPIRNRQMLTEGKPSVVIAFHDDLANSKGTKDMVAAAKKAGIPVYVVSHG